jgi:Zn-dependent protease
MESEKGRDRKVEPSFIPGSIGLIRVFGVAVRLHFTFLLLLVFLISVGVGQRQSDLMSVAYVVLLLASVFLHEIAHALVSRWCRIRTLEIIMFPIGGVSRLERTPTPSQELCISLAGPLANLLLAGALFGVLAYRGVLLPIPALAEPTDANLLQRIAIGNLLLALFNLLPAFPMDGGRLLRALLSFSRPQDQATRIAAGAGQLMAILIGLYGLLSMNFLPVFIAFFVYVGAAQESAAATGRLLTRGIPVRAAMVTDFRSLSHGDSIRDAANLLLATTQQDFPVLHGETVVGLLSRNALLRAMAGEGPDSYVSSAMNRDFIRLSPDTDLSTALPSALRAGSCALVMEGDRLLGLLTAEDLSEFLLLRRFGLQPEPERSAGPPDDRSSESR